MIVSELFEDERGLIELGEVVDRINVHFKFFHACQSVCNSRLGFLQAGRTEKCKKTRFFSDFDPDSIEWRKKACLGKEKRFF